MIRPNRSIAHNHHRHAFSALEALVMLLALFILAMLGIGLWIKKGKDEAVIVQPTPQNTIGIIKPDPSKSDQDSPPSSSEEEAVKEVPEKSAPIEPDNNSQKSKEN